MKASRAAALAAGILLFGVAASAPATSIAATYTVEFSATDFSPLDPSVPADPFQGSLTLTFDPTANAKGVVTVNTVNIPFTGIATFKYVLGANAVEVIGVDDPDDAVSGFDFLLRFGDFLSTPNLLLAVIEDPSSGSRWNTLDGTVSVTETPLPAALPLFATVLAGGGLIAWRRKRRPCWSGRRSSASRSPAHRRREYTGARRPVNQCGIRRQRQRA